jgi:hypothetical protein
MSDQYVVGKGDVPEAVRIGIGNPADRAIVEVALARFKRAYRELC